MLSLAVTFAITPVTTVTGWRAGVAGQAFLAAGTPATVLGWRL